jgi:hypothetical protein
MFRKNALPPFSWWKSKQDKPTRSSQLAGFLTGLFFCPDGCGSTLLGNVGGLLPNYNALHPRI